MTRLASARRASVGWAASAGAAVAATLLLTSSASAATPADGPIPAKVRSMRILFGTVRVFASPSTHAPVKGKLTGTGTGVSVDCWTSGTDYKGMEIWYQISTPVAGYMPAFNVAAHFSPAAGVPHCLVPEFRRQYYALEASLHIRTAPSIGATISGYLANVGSMVIVNCYVSGSAIFGDRVWYHALSPTAGYVTGRFLNTGGDPAPAVPRC
jgi:hypothetical protein